MAFLQLFGGLILLIYAGNVLIRGAVSLAWQLKVSPLVVGMTVIAFGTSAPELLVGVDAVLTGVPVLALGNVVGSNIANILLAIGLGTVFAPVVLNVPKITRNMVIMIFTTLIFIAFAFTGEFTFWKGLLFFAGLFAYIVLSTHRDRKTTSYQDIVEQLDGSIEKPDRIPLAIFFVIGGLAGLSLGAHFFVQGAAELARMLGVPEAIIGLTLVAVGTSIPEIVATVAAAFHKQAGVAIGNVMGSNVFNILGIIGVSSMVGRIPVPQGILYFDIWVMLGCALVPLPFAFLKKDIGRMYGAAFFIAYIVYVIFLAKGISGFDYIANGGV